MKTAASSILFALLAICPAAADTGITVHVPLAGATYPASADVPAGGRMLRFDFEVHCEQGSYGRVRWGPEGLTMGSAEFYGQIAVQVHLPAATGTNRFTIEAGDCGSATIPFWIAQ